MMVNERIVEYPMVWRWIRPSGKVLNFGCATSRLLIHVASLGYEVHGLDLRPYPFEHTNLVFLESNLFDWQPVGLFDIILCISTLEHIGLGAYEGDENQERADAQAPSILRQWLKPNGQLILSVPFGQASVSAPHRIYDVDQIQ